MVVVLITMMTILLVIRWYEKKRLSKTILVYFFVKLISVRLSSELRPHPIVVKTCGEIAEMS